MQCEKFESRLHHLLDRRLPPEADDELLAHTLVCTDCRELLDTQAALFVGLELVETPATSNSFASRVVENASASRRKTGRRPAVSLLLGLAAALLVAAFVTRAARDGAPHLDRVAKMEKPRTGKSQTHKVVAASHEPATAVVPDVTPQIATLEASESAFVAPLAVNPSNFADDYHDLLKQIEAQQYAIVQSQISGENYREFVEQWQSRWRELPAEPVEQIPGGLRPIASSLTVAINLLRSTLPNGKQPPTKPQANLPFRLRPHLG